LGVTSAKAPDADHQASTLKKKGTEREMTIRPTNISQLDCDRKVPTKSAFLGSANRQ